MSAPGAWEQVQERIDRLLTIADRFDHPGGSRRLAQRARDKAAGMETALRLLTAGDETVTEWGMAWADDLETVKWYDRDYIQSKGSPEHGDVIYTRERVLRQDIVGPWVPLQ